MSVVEGSMECTFKKRLKARREEMGLTQTQLATESGCHQSKISDYENLEKNILPELFNAKNLAVALGVSLDWLCGISVEDREIEPSQFIQYILRLIDNTPSSMNIKVTPNPRLIVITDYPAATIEFCGEEMHSFFQALEAFKRIKEQIGDDNYKASEKMIVNQFQQCFAPGWKS